MKLTFQNSQSDTLNTLKSPLLKSNKLNANVANTNIRNTSFLSLIKFKNKSVVIMSFLTILFGISTIFFMYNFYNIINNPVVYGLRRDFVVQKEGDQYLNSLIASLASSKSVDIRKIQDINALRQSNPDIGEFVARAENGDILIILADIEVAFIFRPTNNKIVNIAKIQIKQ